MPKLTFSNVGKILFMLAGIAAIIYILFHKKDIPKSTPVTEHKSASVQKKDTTKAINSADTPKSELQKRLTNGVKTQQVKKGPDSAYKAKNLAMAPNSGNKQTGDNNTQNIKKVLKPREVTKDILNDIEEHFPDKHAAFGVYRTCADNECREFCSKVLKALNDDGYDGVVMAGNITEFQSDDENTPAITFDNLGGKLVVVVHENK